MNRIILLTQEYDVITLPDIWIDIEKFFVLRRESSDYSIDGHIGMWGKDTINRIPYYIGQEKITDPVEYCKYQVVAQLSRDVDQVFGEDDRIKVVTFEKLPAHLSYDSRFPFIVWETIQEFASFKIIGRLTIER